MNVYNQYKNQLRSLDPNKYDNFIKEYKVYKNKRNNNEKFVPSELFTLKGDEFEMYYSAINPREFLAVTLSNQNPLLLKTMNSMDYLAVEKGLKQKFVDYNRTDVPNQFRILAKVIKSEDIGKRGKKKLVLVQTVNIDEVDEQVLKSYLHEEK